MIVCISDCSLTAAEKECIIRIRMRNLIAALGLLVGWIQNGVYDFCHLPLAMKKEITESDKIIEDVHDVFPVSGKHSIVALL